MQQTVTQDLYMLLSTTSFQPIVTKVWKIILLRVKQCPSSNLTHIDYSDALRQISQSPSAEECDIASN